MKKIPSKGELVVCRITRVNPHSAFAYIEDYDREGMIHISEVASGWIKDIKNHLKEGQIVVTKVVFADENVINLSIKRVKREQRKHKLKEYKREKGAEKALEMIAKKMRQAKKFEEIKNMLKEEFGSITKVFELSIRNPELLKRVLTDKWIEQIGEISKKMVKEKEIVVKFKLNLKSYDGDGVNKIKRLLEDIEKLGLEVKYIAAPSYLIRLKTKRTKKLDQEIEKISDKIESIAKKCGCFESLEVLEEED